MDDERESLSWQAFGQASRELAQAIADDGFEPDLILPIARGGLFLARSLGYALAVKNLHVMNVEFYDGVGTTLDMPVMLPPVPSAVDFSAKKVRRRLRARPDPADRARRPVPGRFARLCPRGEEPARHERRVLRRGRHHARHAGHASAGAFRGSMTGMSSV